MPISKKRKKALIITLIVLAVLGLAFIVFLKAEPCPPGEPVPASLPAPPPAPVLEAASGSSTGGEVYTGHLDAFSVEEKQAAEVKAPRKADLL
jgi:hypothetical protein